MPLLRLSSFALLVAMCSAQEPERMLFKAPVISEEERESNYIPDALRCDACLAVANQMSVVLLKAQRRINNKMLKESQVLDLLEELCDEGFEEYGLKDMNGKNRLSGPGLEAENHPGMVQMGGKWPRRIKDICHTFRGDVGEMEIYNVLREDEANFNDFLCRDYCKTNKTNKKQAGGQGDEL